MSFPADCPGCLMGNHERHRRDWNIHPGLIGGNSCACTGDCAERAAADFEASPFGQALRVAVPQQRSSCSHACGTRQLLVTRLNQAIEAQDALEHGTTCTRRLWGDPVGLTCSLRDPHEPGPGRCVYVGGTADDHHTTQDARQAE